MTSVYWIRHHQKPHLAIVARPRGEDRLEKDLLALKSAGIDVLVSLLEPDESIYLGLYKESELAQRAGMAFISSSLPDHSIPTDRQSFCALVLRLTEAIRDGRHVGVHCQGSIGRSTLVTAAVLIQLGWNPKDALNVIEEARGYPVPDTEAQLQWILQYTPCPQRLI
jgi:protein-tyrosine phosphatase